MNGGKGGPGVGTPRLTPSTLQYSPRRCTGLHAAYQQSDSQLGIAAATDEC